MICFELFLDTIFFNLSLSSNIWTLLACYIEKNVYLNAGYFSFYIVFFLFFLIMPPVSKNTMFNSYSKTYQVTTQVSLRHPTMFNANLCYYSNTIRILQYIKTINILQSINIYHYLSLLQYPALSFSLSPHALACFSYTSFYLPGFTNT